MKKFALSSLLPGVDRVLNSPARSLAAIGVVTAALIVLAIVI